MRDWTIAVIIAIIAAYRVIDSWLDNQSEGEDKRESDTYTSTESVHREPGHDDGG